MVSFSDVGIAALLKYALVHLKLQNVLAHKELPNTDNRKHHFQFQYFPLNHYLKYNRLLEADQHLSTQT